MKFLWKLFAGLFVWTLVITATLPIFLTIGALLLLSAVFVGSPKPKSKPASMKNGKSDKKSNHPKKPKRNPPADDLKWIDDLEDLHAALDD